MPWCPKCKAEYQEGFTECKDCKVPLVDELEEAVTYIPFFQAEDQKTAEKLASFYEYSGLHCKTHYDEETECFIVEIPPEYEKDARKLYEAFYVVEAERAAKEAYEKHVLNKAETDETENTSPASSDAEETYEAMDVPSDSSVIIDQEEEETDYPGDFIDDGPSDDISSYEGNKGDETVYVMKSDQYKDLTGTVFIFLIFGIAGVIFVLLNIGGILHVFNGWLPNTVMGVLFLLFIYIAMNTNKKAKKIRSEIDAENLLTKSINNWMKENITESFLASNHNDSVSEEANYISQVDVIKEKLIKEFGSQNLAYLDHLIEEFYSDNFDKDEENSDQ